MPTIERSVQDHDRQLEKIVKSFCPELPEDKLPTIDLLNFWPHSRDNQGFTAVSPHIFRDRLRNALRAAYLIPTSIIHPAASNFNPKNRTIKSTFDALLAAHHDGTPYSNELSFIEYVELLVAHIDTPKTMMRRPGRVPRLVKGLVIGKNNEVESHFYFHSDKETIQLFYLQPNVFNNYIHRGTTYRFRDMTFEFESVNHRPIAYDNRAAETWEEILQQINDNRVAS